jgi:uncharacterized pyridoxamine 5'-phosphate oxidase family protein
VNESDDEDVLILKAMERALAKAGPAMEKNFLDADWLMSVAEFKTFWADRPVASFCTVSTNGAPHVVAIEPTLSRGQFLMNTYANAVRLRDIRANNKVSLLAHKGPYKVVVVYGLAFIDEASLDKNETVQVRVRPTQIYAIRPPAGHHAAGA